MKKSFFLLVATLCLASCTSLLPWRIEKFVDRLEKNYESYSDEQREKSSKKFDKLSDEYTDNYRSFSPEEKERINAAVAKYAKISLPWRIEQFVGSLEQNYESYSEAQRERSSKKFDELFDEYTDNYKSFSPEEKKRINAAVAKYAKISARTTLSGYISNFLDVLNSGMEIIDNIID